MINMKVWADEDGKRYYLSESEIKDLEYNISKKNTVPVPRTGTRLDGVDEYDIYHRPFVNIKLDSKDWATFNELEGFINRLSCLLSEVRSACNLDGTKTETKVLKNVYW